MTCRHFKKQLALALLFLSFFLTGCAVGPNYKKPEVAELTPPDWRWKKAEPNDTVQKGNWWELFQDPQLNELEKKAEASNQDLKAAVSRVDEARATARISAANFFPQISADPSAERFRTSTTNPEIPFPFPSRTANSFSTPLDLSYEVDLWGRVRRSFESAQAMAQASVADYRNVLLTLQSDVALNYFLLRAFDSEVEVLQRTIASRSEAFEIQQLRLKSGLGREIDFEQAKNQLDSAKADLADYQRQREETEHQLALLCGAPASSFQVSAEPLKITAPEIPVGLPSALLERRPGVAEAERNMAAKNAEIGVAYAAFFPSIKITGQGGYLSADTSSLFNWDNHLWSIGPSISLPLLDGGRNAADLKAARATYDEYVAKYRQSVLMAFKDVEDALLDIRKRGEQLAAENNAVESAHRATELARERYSKGAASYLEVIDAERTELLSESTATNVHGQQLVASVKLIKALGGGWGTP